MLFDIATLLGSELATLIAVVIIRCGGYTPSGHTRDRFYGHTLDRCDILRADVMDWFAVPQICDELAQALHVNFG